MKTAVNPAVTSTATGIRARSSRFRALTRSRPRRSARRRLPPPRFRRRPCPRRPPPPPPPPASAPPRPPPAPRRGAVSTGFASVTSAGWLIAPALSLVGGRTLPAGAAFGGRLEILQEGGGVVVEAKGVVDGAVAAARRDRGHLHRRGVHLRVEVDAQRQVVGQPAVEGQT